MDGHIHDVTSLDPQEPMNDARALRPFTPPWQELPLHLSVHFGADGQPRQLTLYYEAEDRVPNEVRAVDFFTYGIVARDAESTRAGDCSLTVFFDRDAQRAVKVRTPGVRRLVVAVARALWSTPGRRPLRGG